MIKVQMNLISAVSRSRDAVLVTIEIYNDGTGSKTRGNYDFVIRGKRGQVMKEGRVENWPRVAKTPCALLQKVINTAYPKGV